MEMHLQLVPFAYQEPPRTSLTFWPFSAPLVATMRVSHQFQTFARGAVGSWQMVPQLPRKTGYKQSVLPSDKKLHILFSKARRLHHPVGGLSLCRFHSLRPRWRDCSCTLFSPSIHSTQGGKSVMHSSRSGTREGTPPWQSPQITSEARTWSGPLPLPRDESTSQKMGFATPHQSLVP